MAEFAAEGRGPGDGSMIGHDLGEYGTTWSSPEGFAAYPSGVRGFFPSCNAAICSGPNTRSPRSGATSA